MAVSSGKGRTGDIRAGGAALGVEVAQLARKVVLELLLHRFEHIFNKLRLVHVSISCEGLNEGSWLWSWRHHKLAHFCEKLTWAVAGGDS